MTVTFEDSGNPKVKLTIEDVRAWALEYGFVKTSVGSDKPMAQRVDLMAFFKTYNTSAFSLFKTKFKSRKLKPPNEHQEEDEVDEERPLTEEEIAEMIAEYERVKDYEARKWRYVKRPGGQAVRPPIWYELYGASQYLNQGENKEPAPVWREDGSIDYGGREKWDAWTKCSGMSEQEAKIAFVRAMRRAESNAKDNFY